MARRACGLLVVVLWMALWGVAKPSGIEDEILDLTNRLRAQHGLAALVQDDRLCQAAREHSQEMLKWHYLSHTSPIPGWTTVSDRVRNYGVSNMQVGENVAYLDNYPLSQVATAVFDRWCQSSGHLANLLRPTYRLTGIGIAVHPQRVLITQVFAEPAPGTIVRTAPVLASRHAPILQVQYQTQHPLPAWLQH